MSDEDDREVARLRYDMRVDGIDRVVAGLERMYGKGLVIDTLRGEGKWMVICTPSPEADPHSGAKS